MTKKKIIQLMLFLPLLLLILNGCDWLADITGTKSGSSSGTTPPDQPAHGQVTYNILEKSPFSGQQLNTTFWTNLDGYCKAGPTQLIICDLNMIPNQMGQAGFPGRDLAKYYAFSRTVNNAFLWAPNMDPSSNIYMTTKIKSMPGGLGTFRLSSRSCRNILKPLLLLL